MNLNEKISLVVQEAEKKLLPLDVMLIKHFLRHHEPELAIEFVCDLFLKDDVVLSNSIIAYLKDIVAELKINPKRSWGGLISIDEKSQRIFRLDIGKDPLEKRRDIESIYLELHDKFEPEHAKHVMEFIDVGEYELALEGLWRYLYDEKIVISRDLMTKIRKALSDNELDPETWVELLVEDK
jgi:hypothetical protein